MQGNSQINPWTFSLSGRLWLLLAIWLTAAGCSGRGVSTPTAIPTFTPSPTPSQTASPTTTPFPTRTRTPEPTPSRSPTVSPTATPTITPYPTLTAAVPVQNNLLYSLANWTPDDAQRLIELLEQYPDLRIGRERGDAYFDGYFYARIAQAEAVLRFPEVIYSPFWRWDLAYNLAQTRDPRAGEQYAFLLEKALERRAVDLVSLDEWIQQVDPRLRARPLVLQALPGFTRTALVEIRAGGSAALLIAERANGDIVSFALSSRFDFVLEPDIDYVVDDLNGDSQDEVVIYQRGSKERTDPPIPLVYSLGELPPQEMRFEPGLQIPIELAHESLWTAASGTEGGRELHFEATLFPACPVTHTRRFRWDGTRFVEVSRAYEMTAEEDLLEFCEPALDHAIRVWGPVVALDLMETGLVPFFRDGSPVTLDAELADRWTLRLGVYQALVGQRVDAQETLAGLAESPRSEDSTWARQADAFLAELGGAGGLYAACATTEFCDYSQALEQTVENLPTISYPLLIDRLGNGGIPVRGSGLFDFDGDGVQERWFTVRHPGRILLEFWISYPGEGRIQAIAVGTSDTSAPSLTVLEAPPGLTVWQLNNQIPRRLIRRESDGTFYVEPYTERGLYAVERVQLAAETAREALLDGENPEQVRNDLLNLEASSAFICPYYLCSDFVYALALANEFAGDERGAVDRYLELWRSYPDSPYTTIARLKLVGEALLPTATLTPTRTPRPSQTVTPTGLPSLTPTPSPTLTYTPTPDPYPAAGP